MRKLNNLFLLFSSSTMCVGLGTNFYSNITQLCIKFLLFLVIFIFIEFDVLRETRDTNYEFETGEKK